LNCVATRERLPEQALGALTMREVDAVEKHLQWCAACRKEARELHRASATLAFSVAPAEPHADLVERAVIAVAEAAGRAPGRKRGRIGVALLIAAALSLSGLGWGAVMAGRASRFQAQADAAQERENASIEKFARTLIGDAPFSDPRNRVFLGPLQTSPGRSGGGTAMIFTSPSIIDFAIVNVTGLRPGPNQRLPFRVTLTGDGLRALMLGTIRNLDTGGGATIYKHFDLNLEGYDHFLVTDAAGDSVLSGDVATGASVSAPSA
jgi:Putative zinc-finger